VWRKGQELKAQSLPEISTGLQVSTSVISTTHKQEPAVLTDPVPIVACIGHGIRVTGEVTGHEDLLVDGEVVGSICIENAVVTVGPNGHVDGPINAREIAVRGVVVGDLRGEDRVHVRNTGQTLGEIQARRIVIDDGAEIRGKVETTRDRQDARSGLAGAKRSEVHAIVALPGMVS
jgi:cytoskeletal protein CcmA (bactofilin family)